MLGEDGRPRANERRDLRTEAIAPVLERVHATACKRNFTIRRVLGVLESRVQRGRIGGLIIRFSLGPAKMALQPEQCTQLCATAGRSQAEGRLVSFLAVCWRAGRWPRHHKLWRKEEENWLLDAILSHHLRSILASVVAKWRCDAVLRMAMTAESSQQLSCSSQDAGGAMRKAR